MIIDAHYHLEERLETVQELLTQMDQHGLHRVALIAPGVGLVDFKGIRGAARLLPRLLMSPWPRMGMLFYDLQDNNCLRPPTTGWTGWSTKGRLDHEMYERGSRNTRNGGHGTHESLSSFS